MNRGFNYYFREGVKSSCRALYKNKGLFRYLVYFFMQLFGRVTLLFNALFDFSDNRQGELIRKNSRIDVSQSFKTAPRGLWTYILTLCVEGLMFLAGLVIIAIITAVLAAIGYAISEFAPVGIDPATMVGIFSAPGGLLFVVYTIVMLLIFSPTAYIIACNEGISVGDTLSACFNTMKSEGKGTLFLGYFVTSLIKLAYLGFVAGIFILLSALLNEYRYEWFYFVVLLVWTLIAVAGFAVAAPIFTLANRSLKNHLFDDIVIDPVSKTKSTCGINVTQCRGQKIAANAAGNALVMLFDETGGEPKETSVPEQTVDLSQAFMNDPSKKIKNKAQPQPQPQPQAKPKQFAPLKSVESETEEEEVPTVGGEIKQAEAANKPVEADKGANTEEAQTEEAAEEKVPTVEKEANSVSPDEEEEVPTVGGEVEAAKPVQPVRPVRPVARPSNSDGEAPASHARPAARPIRPAAKPADEEESPAPARPVRPAPGRGTPTVRILKTDDDDGFDDALPPPPPRKQDDDGFDDPAPTRRRPSFAADSDDDDGFDDGFEEPSD